MARRTEANLSGTDKPARRDFEKKEYGIRKVERPSAVKAAADAMREEIFCRGTGDIFLGSEEELIRRLGISRPTFRQAVGLLQHEQLLESRRGVGGGFYTTRPTVDAASHLASIHLFFADTRLIDLLRATVAPRILAARLLASNPDATVRLALRGFLDRHKGFEALRDMQVNVRVRNGFDRLMADLCGNPAVHLFLEIGRHIDNVVRLSTENPMGRDPIQRWITFMETLADHIADGDADAAASAVAMHIDDLIRHQIQAHR